MLALVSRALTAYEVMCHRAPVFSLEHWTVVARLSRGPHARAPSHTDTPRARPTAATGPLPAPRAPIGSASRFENSTVCSMHRRPSRVLYPEA